MGPSASVLTHADDAQDRPVGLATTARPREPSGVKAPDASGDTE
jgi:hypothetical protein